MSQSDPADAIRSPEISVILPVYNGEKYIRKCIGSVFAQTGQRVELIVVDDASSDTTLDIVKELNQTCPPEMELRVIQHKKNCGMAVGRNEGVLAARGTYLFFIDGDDWIPPDCFGQMIALADQYNADVCCGSYEFYYDSKESETAQPRVYAQHFYATNEEVLEAYCGLQLPVFTWNKLIRRELFVETGLIFEESIMNDEDQLWCFRLVLRSQRWVNTGTATYFYRKDNQESVTANTYTARRLGNYYTVLDHMWHDVAEIGRYTEPQKKLIARAIHKFTKSILWHIELDEGVDYRALYKEFNERNVLKGKNWARPCLDFKARCFALGWTLPYPVNRWFNPSFLSKQRKRLTGHG